MTTALQAGGIYAVAVFAIGVVLGTLRVVFLQPALGELPAVLVELPLMLAVSWIVCRRVMFRLEVPHRRSVRIATGLVAFAVLQALEWALAHFGFGRSAVEILAGYRSLAGMLGLLAQLGFAAMPALLTFPSPAFRS